MQLAREAGFKRIIRYIIFTLWQIIFDMLPFFPLRIWWLQIWGAKIGVNTVVDKIDFMNLDQTGLKGLTIGNNSFIGRGTLLDLAGKITMGSYATVGPRVIILSHFKVGILEHPLLHIYPSKKLHTTIEENTFVGAGAVLTAGVKIGQGSVIGAGGVVNQSIPARTLAAGVPAKVIKKIA